MWQDGPDRHVTRALGRRSDALETTHRSDIDESVLERDRDEGLLSLETQKSAACVTTDAAGMHPILADHPGLRCRKPLIDLVDLSITRRRQMIIR